MRGKATSSTCALSAARRGAKVLLIEKASFAGGNVHGVRVPANPTSASDLSRAEMQGRADAHAMFRAWKRDVPAFAEAYFLEAYPWIGVRESRRITGRHVHTEDDLKKGRRFDDAIATGCW